MSYTTTITARVSASGTQGEGQELTLTNTVLNSNASSVNTYVFTPGQERECCANILAQGQQLLAKYYVIESNFPVEVAVSSAVPGPNLPTIYSQPAGKFFMWVNTTLGASLSSIKVRSLATNTTNTDVTVMLGYS
jgi:hypothetical protein